MAFVEHNIIPTMFIENFCVIAADIVGCDYDVSLAKSGFHSLSLRWRPNVGGHAQEWCIGLDFLLPFAAVNWPEAPNISKSQEPSDDSSDSETEEKPSSSTNRGFFLKNKKTVSINSRYLVR